ncbi:MAG: MerR family transcriptional regulator [Chloroflexota bacterium]
MKKAADTLDRNDLPVYPIGVVAELLGITDQTLRLYEKHGLIKPARRNKNRYYSHNDLKWLGCIRDLIHLHKISIEGIKKLVEYAPCWEIKQCPEEVRKECSAPRDRTKSCWEINKSICKVDSGQSRCGDCVVFLSRQHGESEEE